jgi:hypothetical protein
MKYLPVALLALLLPLQVFAAPVEMDTPDAHIIVVRSIDAWSGDESTSEDSLSAFEKRKAGFILKHPKEENGYPMLLQGISDDPVVQGVNTNLKSLNFKLAQEHDFFLRIGDSVTIIPNEYGQLVNVQKDLFKFFVEKQGNPKDLSGKTKVRKFFGTLLSFGTVIVAGNKFGAAGAQGAIGADIPGSVYQISASGQAAVTPLEIPSFDTTGYQSIDVRRVIQGNNDRVGQIIIAYRKEKTEAAENEALIKAIVSLVGADTTVDAIKQARAEDLTHRQAIWDACVAEGKCKNDD